MKNIEIQRGKIQFSMTSCVHSNLVTDEEADAVTELHYHSTNMNTVQKYFDSLNNGWDYEVSFDFSAHGGMTLSYNITRARVKLKR